MKIHKAILLLVVLTNQLIINAQNITALKISYANDLFAGTDQYFTQGIRIELISPVFKKTPVSFLTFLPQNEGLVYHSIAIQQDGFTPTSIRYDSILADDRPFCGSLFFTNSLYVCAESKKALFHTQLDIGAIGPLALGFEEQTAIHKAINDELPKGWKNQIQNDLILNYKVAIQKSLFEKKLLDISMLSEIRMGTMYTDAALGGKIRFGIKEKWYSGIGVGKHTKPQIYTFAKGNIKAVGYNATMQGGLMNRTSAYTINTTEINRVVASSEFGIVTSYKRIQVEYAHTYISKEFKKGMPHAWGKLSLLLSL